MHKYVHQNGSTTMMVTKRSAGVAPEVNHRISMHVSQKAGKRGIQPGFETLDRPHEDSKAGTISGPTKGLMSSKN